MKPHPKLSVSTHDLFCPLICCLLLYQDQRDSTFGRDYSFFKKFVFVRFPPNFNIILLSIVLEKKKKKATDVLIGNSLNLQNNLGKWTHLITLNLSIKNL